MSDPRTEAGKCPDCDHAAIHACGVCPDCPQWLRAAQEAPAPEGLALALWAASRDPVAEYGEMKQAYRHAGRIIAALAATPPAPAEPPCNTPTCNGTCHDGPCGPCGCQEPDGWDAAADYPADWREVEPDAPLGFLHCEADGCGQTIDHATAMR